MADVRPKLVRIVLDATLPPGKYRVGDGVRVVSCEDDAAVGRELRTVVVACRGEVEAARMREIVAADDNLELA